MTEKEFKSLNDGDKIIHNTLGVVMKVIYNEDVGIRYFCNGEESIYAGFFRPADFSIYRGSESPGDIDIDYISNNFIEDNMNKESSTCDMLCDLENRVLQRLRDFAVSSDSLYNRILIQSAIDIVHREFECFTKEDED